MLELDLANAIQAQPVLAPILTPGTLTPHSNTPDILLVCSPTTLQYINALYSRTATTLIFIPVHPILCRTIILLLSYSLSLPILRKQVPLQSRHLYWCRAQSFEGAHIMCCPLWTRPTWVHISHVVYSFQFVFYSEYILFSLNVCELVCMCTCVPSPWSSSCSNTLVSIM